MINSGAARNDEEGEDGGSCETGRSGRELSFLFFFFLSNFFFSFFKQRWKAEYGMQLGFQNWRSGTRLPHEILLNLRRLHVRQHGRVDCHKRRTVKQVIYQVHDFRFIINFIKKNTVK